MRKIKQKEREWYKKKTMGNVDLILDYCDIRILKNGRIMIVINTFPHKAVDMFSFNIYLNVVNDARNIPRSLT